MTVNDLWCYALKGAKAVEPVAFEKLRNTILGIDISIWMHRCCANEQVALCMNCQPLYPPSNALSVLQSWHSALTSKGVIPYYVFDGCQHIMKSVAREKRDLEKQKSRDWINNLYQKGHTTPLDVTDTERKKMVQHFKKVTCPDKLFVSLVVQWMKSDNSIRFECAPFEVEWQLVHLQRRGVIKYIYTTDGDSIILGADKVITNIDFKKQLFIIVEKDNILDKKNDFLLSRFPEQGWSNIACLLGCNYVARVPGVGPITVFNKILPAHGGNNDLSTYLEDALLTKLKSVSKNVPTDFDDRYRKAANLFKFCPILDGTGALSPLNPLPANKNWEELIGFDPFATLPVSQAEFVECSSFGNSLFLTIDGGQLPEFPVPMYSPLENPMVPTTVCLPHFARINFDTIPILCADSVLLQGFLAARFGYTYVGDRADVENAVVRAIAIGKEVLAPEKVPKQIGEWSMSEVLVPMQQNLGWSSRHDAHACICNNLQTIGDISVKNFYPKGDENNRNQAMEIFDGGNLLLTTSLAMQECCSVQEDNTFVYLFKCVCVPSMKTTAVSANEDNTKEVDGYRVFLAFDVCSGGTVLGYPFSCCGCYDG